MENFPAPDPFLPAAGIMQRLQRALRGQAEFTARLGVKASPTVLARGMLAAFRCDETATLSAVPGPALVITADGDRVLMPLASARMAQAMPDARLVAVPRARHQALLQRHPHVIAALVSFTDACFLPLPVAVNSRAA